jgi:cytochrome b561
MWVDPAFADVANSAAKYGPLADLVKSAGFLVAATLALSLGWMKRAGSSWVPPEEAVPKATTASASLVTMVLLALLFVFLDRPERMPILAAATVLFLIFALIGLFFTIYFMKTYGFETKRIDSHGKEVKAIKLVAQNLLAMPAKR